MDSNMFSLVEGSLSIKSNLYISCISDRFIDSIQLILSFLEIQLHGNSKFILYLNILFKYLN